ncbi:MAG: DUF5320 domain-containing protein [Anaerolineae bacterium]|jgi:hypothetical protein
MPAGDGTGPAGMGPMTGRGAGYCGGYDAPGHANPVPGRGYGMGWGRGGAWGGGWGRGRGWRHWYYATGLPGWARFGYAPAWGPYGPSPAPEQEVEFLKAQAEGLKAQMEAISRRIAELEEEE